MAARHPDFCRHDETRIAIDPRRIVRGIRCGQTTAIRIERSREQSRKVLRALRSAERGDQVARCDQRTVRRRPTRAAETTTCRTDFSKQFAHAQPRGRLAQVGSWTGTASPMKPLNFENSERFCVFQSGDNWFALPSLAIRSVVPERQITPMPHSDPLLRGIGYVQNEFIPIVSLRALMHVEYDAAIDAGRQVMILLGAHGPWGLSIDRASALVPLETSYSTYSNRDDNWSRVVVGSATYLKHVVQVLDPVAIYQYASRLLDMFWQDHGRSDIETTTSSLETIHAS